MTFFMWNECYNGSTGLNNHFHPHFSHIHIFILNKLEFVTPGEPLVLDI